MTDKLQVVSTIINHKTKQFFNTFNNEDCATKGLSRLIGNYRYLIKRQGEIKTGVRPAEETPYFYNLFDSGIFWAFHNTKNSLEDWVEYRAEQLIPLNAVKDIERKLSEILESFGYANVRVYKAKGPEKRLWDTYGWGKWNPNKTQKQFHTMMIKVGKAMNKEFPLQIVNRAWYESVKKEATINNKNDLWDFFEAHGLFSNG